MAELLMTPSGLPLTYCAAATPHCPPRSGHVSLCSNTGSSSPFAWNAGFLGTQ